MADPVTWTVGKQAHTSQLVDGNAVAGVSIPVELSTDETFTVFVPGEVYNRGVAAVREVLQAAVNHHVGVARLSGEV